MDLPDSTSVPAHSDASIPPAGEAPYLLDDVGPPLTTREVADLFAVHLQTVTAWARSGRLPSFRTPGGRHRYRESDVRALLDRS